MKVILSVLSVFVLFSCNGNDSNNGKLNSEIIREFDLDKEPEQTINLHEEISFGDSSELPIGRLGTSTIDENGNIYLSDDTQLKIHVFDPDGKHLETIGGEGNGPGEFQSINSMVIISDQLFVLDSRNQRLSSFSIRDYRINETLSLNSDMWDHIEELDGARVADLIKVDNGRLLLQFSKMVSIDERWLYYHAIDDENRVESEQILKQRDANIFADNTNGFAVSMILPFSRKSLQAFSGDGQIYTAWNDSLFIKEYNMNGDVQGGIYYPLNNRDLSADDVLNRYENEQIQRAVKNADFPDTWPVMDRFLADDEERLWVSLVSENHGNEDWWVLKTTGEKLAVFKWSKDKRILLVNNGFLYSREQDEESGAYELVRYRINIL